MAKRKMPMEIMAKAITAMITMATKKANEIAMAAATTANKNTK